MKPYDRLEIYEDPITKIKYEGTATLLEAEDVKCRDRADFFLRFPPN